MGTRPCQSAKQTASSDLSVKKARRIANVVTTVAVAVEREQHLTVRELGVMPHGLIEGISHAMLYRRSGHGPYIAVHSPETEASRLQQRHPQADCATA
jgi:hypothetical protein